LDFLRRWMVTTIGVLVAASMVSGIHYDDTSSLLLASLVLGVLNAVLRPIMLLLSLPIVILTLGLFTLVVNAALLLLAGKLVSTFHVEGFSSAFWGALVISIVSIILNLFFGGGIKGNVNVRINRGPRKPPGGQPPVDTGGSGPVIDV